MNYISKMLSPNTGVSSKRVVGTFCIAVYTGILIGTFIGLTLTEDQVDLLVNLLYIGGGLLGVGTFEKYSHRNYNRYNYDYEDNYNYRERETL